LFEEEVGRDEAAQLRLAALLEVDAQDFDTKKKYTTAMRRLVPDGIATALVVTGNHRTWRWLIGLRTERHNDEEVRQVFADVWRQQKSRYPNLYADSSAIEIDGFEEVTFENDKI
jgi:thymidylate synthase (FAD)